MLPFVKNTHTHMYKSSFKSSSLSHALHFLALELIIINILKQIIYNHMIFEMMNRFREVLVLLFLSILSKAININSKPVAPDHALRRQISEPNSRSYCLSWRLAVETNNIRAWRTVPPQCMRHIESYMIGGQYEHDVNLIVDNIITYIDDITISNDELDAWILDVDDTLISNLFYYKGKRFGCDPYDPQAFKTWASMRGCPAIPGALRLFRKLVEVGIKVFIVTGRDEQTLGQPTRENLDFQGFSGYERLILRSEAYRGMGASAYKSEIRRKLVEEEGYRIWGNVGDQWSDLQGQFTGNRTFKLPNPMYFVP